MRDFVGAGLIPQKIPRDPVPQNILKKKSRMRDPANAILPVYNKN
jgi:hypothetical protein